MRAGLLAPAEPLQALAEREVAVVRRRIDLEQRLERHARPLGLARVEVGPAERLEDRALARLEPVGPLEDDGGLGVVPLGRAVAGRAGGGRRRSRGSVGVGPRRRVARTACARWWHGASRWPPAVDAGARSAAGYRLAVGGEVHRPGAAGESVRPGIRPRLAIGWPSISLMSPVKSIGVAPLMYDPTAYESTGAPASLK